MQFRPCIDIHNGKVKQIVGGTLKDEGNKATENFVSEYDAAYFANLYKKLIRLNNHLICSLNFLYRYHFINTKSISLIYFSSI